MRILVALSGGIDSSVVAHVLRRAGHDLVAVRFTLWTDPLAPAIAQVLPSKCCNAQTAARALATAKELDIPYHIVDLEADFKTHVVDPYLEAHRNGQTPNPCILCNRTMKFGRLVDLMREYGCERVATGHYAQIGQDGSRLTLLRAIDADKDQSYYLSGLNQAQLGAALFPLGGMLKQEVFALAKSFGVPYDEYYRESQDLCFFPEKTPQAFLERHLGQALRPGPIVRRDGRIVGSHRGLALYTPGQRRGLGIGGLRIPLEVVEKRAESNTLIVADQGQERCLGVELEELHWIAGAAPAKPITCQTRSLGTERSGSLTTACDRVSWVFHEPVEMQSPGQYAVFYSGPEVLGSARIAGVIRARDS